MVQKIMKPIVFSGIVDRKRFSTAPERSTLLAGDDFFDGKMYERGEGQNRFLYKSKKNPDVYFLAIQTKNIKDIPPTKIQPISKEQAIDIFEQFPNKYQSFEDSFPGVEIEEI